MFKKLRKIAGTKSAGAVIYCIARLYCAMLRLKIENENEWFDYLEQGGRVLICGWHQQFFIGIRVFNKYRKYQPALMSSKSLDGQIAGGIAGRAGFHTVWGSSSNSASAALKEMIHRLRDHRMAGHILMGRAVPRDWLNLARLLLPAALAP